MSRKSKGINAERELIHLFWAAQGWTACRVAGSGSMKYPSPDIIAGNITRRLAIECKASKSKYQYFDKREIEELRQYSELFNAEAWVAVKFDRMPWYFIRIEDLKTTNTRFTVDLDFLMEKGVKIEFILSG